jgi:hypothetical protein
VSPIFEQGQGKGIGHSLESFLQRFDAICADHLATQRAVSFAFIFYDFRDDSIRKILKDQGVFAQLDRLAGERISIFYLHSRSEDSVKVFNARFLSELGIEKIATLPCVVFFQVHGKKIRDVEIAQLESADLIHGFRELYGAIERYLGAQHTASSSGSRAIRWLKSSTGFVSLEVFRDLLEKGIDQLF